LCNSSAFPCYSDICAVNAGRIFVQRYKIAGAIACWNWTSAAAVAAAPSQWASSAVDYSNYRVPRDSTVHIDQEERLDTFVQECANQVSTG